jgi:hypothetical protein
VTNDDYFRFLERDRRAQRRARARRRLAVLGAVLVGLFARPVAKHWLSEPPADVVAGALAVITYIGLAHWRAGAGEHSA